MTKKIDKKTQSKGKLKELKVMLNKMDSVPTKPIHHSRPKRLFISILIVSGIIAVLAISYLHNHTI